MVTDNKLIRQCEGKFPRPSYNHDLLDIVTTEHLTASVCVGGRVWLGGGGTVLPPSLENLGTLELL